MTDELAIEAVGLEKSYGAVRVLAGVDLRVSRGSVLALLGPNGAGKTTILQTVAGLLPAISGEITVVGQSPSVRRPYLAARHGLAYVPDSRCLFQSLTVRQNLAIAARRSRSDVDSVFEYLPALKPLSKRDAGLLSGGEQQMLAIARVLRAGPTLLLLDEPSEGLAPVVVQQIQKILRGLKAEGMAMLLVEQNLHFALSLADRHTLLVDGEVKETLTTPEVRARNRELLDHLSV